MTIHLSLWLQILLSAGVVFILSSLIHKVGQWHASDYRGFSNEAAPPPAALLPVAQRCEIAKLRQLLAAFRVTHPGNPALTELFALAAPYQMETLRTRLTTLTRP